MKWILTCYAFNIHQQWSLKFQYYIYALNFFAQPFRLLCFHICRSIWSNISCAYDVQISFTSRSNKIYNIHYKNITCSDIYVLWNEIKSEFVYQNFLYLLSSIHIMKTVTFQREWRFTYNLYLSKDSVYNIQWRWKTAK